MMGLELPAVNTDKQRRQVRFGVCSCSHPGCEAVQNCRPRCLSPCHPSARTGDLTMAGAKMTRRQSSEPATPSLPSPQAKLSWTRGRRAVRREGRRDPGGRRGEGGAGPQPRPSERGGCRSGLSFRLASPIVTLHGAKSQPWAELPQNIHSFLRTLRDRKWGEGPAWRGGPHAGQGGAASYRQVPPGRSPLPAEQQGGTCQTKDRASYTGRCPWRSLAMGRFF